MENRIGLVKPGDQTYEFILRNNCTGKESPLKWTRTLACQICKVYSNLLKNTESNAEVKDLDVDALYISHIQVNQAPKQRHRTYHAHGRINRECFVCCNVKYNLSFFFIKCMLIILFSWKLKSQLASRKLENNRALRSDASS
ncbi:hypothetical protein FEM48_Zijuj04G0083800 [Ziziphus jujuba var. spinosa]|uniref:Uncharacterized protein n=1 Tax=Ziziphus jujuba var. spinosa TaxID=714518 RepID=A0A978VIT6_ZIZJJ|nr:hypothetical protein FEM48_Zijuj04G0083800 [Ziziphus jujuba var. spinosa]